MDTAERSLGIAVLPLGGDLQVVGIGMSGVCSYMRAVHSNSNLHSHATAALAHRLPQRLLRSFSSDLTHPTICPVLFIMIGMRRPTLT
jgi:hypothetical protein